MENIENIEKRENIKKSENTEIIENIANTTGKIRALEETQGNSNDCLQFLFHHIVVICIDRFHHHTALVEQVRRQGVTPIVQRNDPKVFDATHHLRENLNKLNESISI